jgi:AAHS family 4-hydroxybenzoate transporter-like MFS transporter
VKPFNVSEAIDSIGINKLIWKIFFLVGFSTAFDGFDYMLVSYTMPQIAAELGLNAIQTGSLASWSSVGMLIGATVSGLISDKIGRRKMISGFVFVFSIFTFPVYFINSYDLYIVLRVGAGIGLGACVPVVAVMLSELAPINKRAIFVSLNTCFMTVGYVLAGIVATAIIPAFGWRMCYLLGGIPFIYAIYQYYHIPESVHWLASKGRKAEACEILNHFQKVSTGSPGQWKPENLILPPPPEAVGLKALFVGKYLRITVTLAMLEFMLYFILYGINAWMPSLMLQKGFPLTTAYIITTAQNVSAILSGLFCGYASELIGRKKNAAIGFIITAATLIALALVTGFWPILCVNIFLGFIRSYTASSVPPITVESFRTEFRNTGVSFCVGVGRASGIIAPIIVGYVLQKGLGYTGAVLLFVLPCIIAVILLASIKGETRGKTFEQLAEEYSTMTQLKY